MSEKLLPCPFCGSQAEMVEEGHLNGIPWVFPRCSNDDCGANCGTAEDWNRRAQPEVALERAVVEAAMAKWQTRHRGKLYIACAALDRARKGGE